MPSPHAPLTHIKPLDDAGFEARLVALGGQRMPTGELCPLELLPSPDCVERLYVLLERVGLGEHGTSSCTRPPSENPVQ